VCHLLYFPLLVSGEVCVRIDLLNIEDEPIRFDERLQLEPERLDTSQVMGTVSVQVSGVVRALGETFHIHGSYEAVGSLTCGRCLEPVPWQVAEEFTAEYRTAASHPADDEIELEANDLEVGFLTESVLDLADVAAEQVLLALPIRIVCDDDCAGLCPQCGANRNVANACTCEPEMDPRWQALRDVAGRDTTN
jgi:uncharacterized protein